MPCRDLSSLDIGVKLRIEDTMIPCIACLSNKHLHDMTWRDCESFKAVRQLYIIIIVVAVAATWITVAATTFGYYKTQTRLHRSVELCHM